MLVVIVLMILISVLKESEYRKIFKFVLVHSKRFIHYDKSFNLNKRSKWGNNALMIQTEIAFKCINYKYFNNIRHIDNLNSEIPVNRLELFIYF